MKTPDKILNYTTRIEATKTAGEIQQLLLKINATAFMTEYDGQKLKSLSFRVNTPHGTMSFQLPAKIDGVYKILKNNRKIAAKYRTDEQAVRIAWRILKSWIEAQVALIQLEIVDVTEAFLQYSQDQHGVTLYDKLKETKFKQIAHKS